MPLAVPIHGDGGGGDRQPPAPGHGVPAVVDQVHQHLLDLAGIGGDHQVLAGQLKAEVDVLADEPRQDLVEC